MLTFKWSTRRPKPTRHWTDGPQSQVTVPWGYVSSRSTPPAPPPLPACLIHTNIACQHLANCIDHLSVSRKTDVNGHMEVSGGAVLLMSTKAAVLVFYADGTFCCLLPSAHHWAATAGNELETQSVRKTYNLFIGIALKNMFAQTLGNNWQTYWQK